jgi:hypothetical protein
MKTLKRTLVALAALTVASMSVSTMAFAAETTEANTESTSTATDPSATDPSATDPSNTTEATTEAASEAENKGTAGANTVITIGTVTVEPGTTTVEVPVTVSPNAGFCGTGIMYSYDSAITYSTVNSGNIKAGDPVEATTAGSVALTTGAAAAVTTEGTLYTLVFNIPADATAGTTYAITGSVSLLSDADNKETSDYYLVDGAIVIAGAEEESTEAASETATVAATAAASATVTRVGSSPATGEALPIAGAVAAVAVIGGVAIASKKRK